jgi:branched-chain amino acid transport system ATP-binding protein
MIIDHRTYTVHPLELAFDIADYAHALQTGRTVLEGPPAELEKNEPVQEIYLGIGKGGAAKGASA